MTPPPASTPAATWPVQLHLPMVPPPTGAALPRVSGVATLRREVAVLRDEVEAKGALIDVYKKRWHLARGQSGGLRRALTHAEGEVTGAREAVSEMREKLEAMGRPKNRTRSTNVVIALRRDLRHVLDCPDLGRCSRCTDVIRRLDAEGMAYVEEDEIGDTLDRAVELEATAWALVVAIRRSRARSMGAREEAAAALRKMEEVLHGAGRTDDEGQSEEGGTAAAGAGGVAPG